MPIERTYNYSRESALDVEAIIYSLKRVKVCSKTYIPAGENYCAVLEASEKAFEELDNELDAYWRAKRRPPEGYGRNICDICGVVYAQHDPEIRILAKDIHGVEEVLHMCPDCSNMVCEVLHDMRIHKPWNYKSPYSREQLDKALGL